MTGRAVAQAVEQAVRDQLAATDQPLAALQAIAEELFSALENVAAAAASQQEAEALALARFGYGKGERILPAGGGGKIVGGNTGFCGQAVCLCCLRPLRQCLV